MAGPALFIALLLAVASPATAALPPAKPYAQLAGEVIGFLFSDVGRGGIRTNDNLPGGYPVPPYFYHYGIYDGNALWSGGAGYPGYPSVSYPGFTACVAIDAFLDWYRFSGDPRALARARQYADWILEHRTPPGDLYGNCPYSTQTNAVMGGGWDGDAIMTDKPAMFGLRLLRLYDTTGDTLYWRGAREIAATLAATQLRGATADDGRWPFRVRPSDGAVRQDYTSHLVPAVRFFGEMATRLGGFADLIVSARAWNWLLLNPCNPASPSFQRWEAFYEDQDPAMQTGKHDHYSAHEMIDELIARRPPGWQDLAIAILDTASARYLIDRPDMGIGVYIPATFEWSGWMEATYASSLQYACASLNLYDALAGDPRQRASWRDTALAMAAACSYGQENRASGNTDGRMFTTLKDITIWFNGVSWYEQNFNTVKYYLRLMALDPSLAPANENHMLASTTAVRSIVYPPASPTLRYETAGGGGRETLRTATAPTGVRANAVPLAARTAPPAVGETGWYRDPLTGVLTVAHADGPVEVLFAVTGVGPGGASGAPTLRAAGGPGAARLTLSTPARVSAAVFDLRGRRVAALLDGVALAAGEHALRWDGRDARGRPVASGAYFLRVSAGDAVVSCRVAPAR